MDIRACPCIHRLSHTSTRTPYVHIVFYHAYRSSAHVVYVQVHAAHSRDAYGSCPRRGAHTHTHMRETLKELLANYAGARTIYERWMEWEPDENAWLQYVKFEERPPAATRHRTSGRGATPVGLRAYSRVSHAHRRTPQTWIGASIEHVVTRHGRARRDTMRRGATRCDVM